MSSGSLGFLGIHSIEVAVFDSQPWLNYFTNGFGFQHTASSTGEYEKRRGYRTHTLQCRDVRIILLESVAPKSEVASYLAKHTEGVSHVNFLVRNLDATAAKLDQRYAAFIDFPLEEKVGTGVFRSVAIATPLGDVNFRFVEVQGSANIVPGQEPIADFNPEHNPLGIIELDHLTSNTRTLQPLIAWYEGVLGLERYWHVEFHTDDLKPGVGTGLRSIVAWDPESKKIKLANNEPLRPRFDESQIQIYVHDNNGPGIQHAAFRVENLLKTVETCDEKLVSFLSTPKEYYDAVPERIRAQNMGQVKEPLSELQKHGLLIDGEDGGYLLQIFCKDQATQFGRANAGPLFIELIQRNGCDGFGEGNFRALFESIERQQQSSK